MLKVYRCVLLLVFGNFLIAAQAWGQCPISVDAGEDIYLCQPPTPTQLNGSISGDYLNFSWSPLSGLTGANSLSPSISVNQTTTYTLTASAVDESQNGIINGDFESGNSGFTSEYIESPGNLWPEGVYEVLSDPSASHPNFAACGDHTSGSGNMMAVNGAGVPNVNVWCQTVNVMPNTQYAFSAWVTTLVTASPAQLQFSINGAVIGPIYTAPPQNCVWTQFYTIWNSGGSSSATICIVNQNTAISGNDFALDDISFAPICTVTDTVTAHVININALANPSTFILPCEGSTVQLSGLGSSTGQDITYLWETADGNIVSGETTLNPVVDAPGIYTLNVVFDNGFITCIKKANVTVIASPNPFSAWILTPGPLGCGSPTLTLFGNSSQLGFSTFEWTTPDGNIVSGANSKNCVIDAPGIYDLLVTNTLTGCTATASTSVTAATNPPTAVAAAAPGVLDCNSSLATLTGTGSSTGAGITYAWTAFNGGQIGGGQNQLNATATAPGTYVLAVTNTANNCVTTDTAVIVNNAVPPNVNIQNAGLITCVSDTVLISGSSSSSNAQLNWSAYNGGVIIGQPNPNTIQVEMSGSYVLTAVDTINGCTGADTIQIVANQTPPLVNILAADTLDCAQLQTTLSGTGSSTGSNFAYNWTGVQVLSGADSIEAQVGASGWYFLQIVNQNNGCTSIDSVFVPSNVMPPPADAGVDGLLTCNQTVYLLTANPGQANNNLIFHWTALNGGNLIAGPDSIQSACDAAGLYTVLVTNTLNGCTATDTMMVTANQVAPSLNVLAQDTLSCTVNNVTIAIQAGGSGPNLLYEWDTATGNILSGADTANPLVSAPGVYTVTVTDPANACTNAQIAVVPIDTLAPQILVDGIPSLSCAIPQASIDAAAMPGQNILASWTSSNGLILSGSNTLMPSVGMAGDYQLTVTNLLNGCTNTEIVQVNANLSPPMVNAGLPDTLDCGTTTLLLTGAASGQGLLNVQWTALGTGNILSGANSLQIQIDAPGIYVLAATDDENGCAASDTVTIYNDENAPLADAGMPDTLNCSTTQLNLQANASMGPNYNYQWTSANGGNIVSGANGLSPLVNTPGSYQLLVSNTANGCTDTDVVWIAEDVLPPAVDAGSSPTLTCTTLSAALSGSATGSNVQYSWTTANGNILSGANTANPTVNQPGLYTLLVLNQHNGCTASDAVAVLLDNTAPILSTSTPALLTCTTLQTNLNGQAQVANGNFSAQWTTTNGNILSGASTLTPTVDAPGIYLLQVQDSQNGCTATTTVTVNENIQAPIANAGATGLLTCNILQTNLDGSGSSAGPGISYLWTSPNGAIVSGANSTAPIISAPGSYQILVSNSQNGCTASAITTVGIDTLHPQAPIATPATLNCLLNQTTLSTNNAGPNFNYLWTTSNGNILSGANSTMPSIGQAGQYQLLVSNTTNGCTATNNVTVSADYAAPVAIAGPSGLLHCLQTSTTLSGSANGATQASYAWSSANGHILSAANTANPTVDAPGQYVLLVTNQANGCTGTASTTVISIPPPQIQVATQQPDCHTDFGSITSSILGNTGQPPFTWALGGAASQQNSDGTFTQLAPGAYSVTISDQYGCTDVAFAQLAAAVDPTLDLPDWVQIDFGDSIRLAPLSSIPTGQVDSWEWTPSQGLSCSDCERPWARPFETTVYQLVVSDLNGCTAQADVQVRVSRKRDIYAPNVFSPNGDGWNDFFSIFGKGVAEIESLKIFDRWGNEVWEAAHLAPNEETQGWDGRFRGEELNPAVFVWQAVVIFADGDVVVFAGDVSLVR